MTLNQPPTNLRPRWQKIRAKSDPHYTRALICPHCQGLLNQDIGTKLVKRLGATKFDIGFSLAFGLVYGPQHLQNMFTYLFGDGWQNFPPIVIFLLWLLDIFIPPYICMRISKRIYRNQVTWVEAKQ